MLDVMDSPLHGMRAAKPSAKFELLRTRDFRPITLASSLAVHCSLPCMGLQDRQMSQSVVY